MGNLIRSPYSVRASPQMSSICTWFLIVAPFVWNPCIFHKGLSPNSELFADSWNICQINFERNKVMRSCLVVWNQFDFWLLATEILPVYLGSESLDKVKDHSQGVRHGIWFLGHLCLQRSDASDIADIHISHNDQSLLLILFFFNLLLWRSRIPCTEDS